MKHMNLKRFGSIVLTGAMALSLAAPAFADDYKTEITGKYQAITLAVTVSPTGSALINPYGLPITLPDDETVISGEQITTATPLTVINQSEVDLAVSAKVTGTPKGTGVSFVGSAVDPDTETSKNIFVQFEAFPAPGVDEDNYDDDELSPMFAALKSEDAALTATVDATEAPATGNLVLRKGNDEEVQDGGVAFVRLSGSVAKAPTVGWADTDGFEVKVVYTFEPSVFIAPITLTTSAEEITSSAGAGTATLEVVLPEGVTSVSDVKWTGGDGNTSYITFVGGDTASNGKLTGTATYVKSTTAAKAVTISVSFKGNDGMTYQSNSVTITVPKGG